MELREALTQITEIRQQMARSEIFHGYRSLPIASTGAIAILGAFLQPVLVVSPREQLDHYLALWFGIAAIGIALPGIQLIKRVQCAGPGVSREQTRLAIEQFLPCLLVGGLLTICLYKGPSDTTWTLPGLWSLLFALGIFSSGRLVPSQLVWAGLYYALVGCYCLLVGHGEQAFAPWQMGVSFGGGQLLTAAILYFTLERHHGR